MDFAEMRLQEQRLLRSWLLLHVAVRRAAKRMLMNRQRHPLAKPFEWESPNIKVKPANVGVGSDQFKLLNNTAVA